MLPTPSSAKTRGHAPRFAFAALAALALAASPLPAQLLFERTASIQAVPTYGEPQPGLSGQWLVDLNGDGERELVRLTCDTPGSRQHLDLTTWTADRGEGRSIEWTLVDRAPFRARTFNSGQYDTARGHVLFGDWNGDGLLDQAIVGRALATYDPEDGYAPSGPWTQCILRDRTGPGLDEFAEPRLAPSHPFLEGIYTAAAKDLDGDGDLDIIACGAAASGVGPVFLVWTNQGGAQGGASGEFTKELLTVFPDNPSTPGGSTGSLHETAAAYEDFDLDGDVDLMLAGHKAPLDPFALRLLRNDGAGNFSVEEPFDPATVILGFAAADIDSDGDADLVVVEPVGPHPASRMVLYANLGGIQRGVAGIFSPKATIAQLDGPNSRPLPIAAGDLNGDGLLEIVYPGDNRLGVFSLLEAPTGGSLAVSARWHPFAGVGLSSNFLQRSSFIDLDADGATDLLVGAGQEMARVWNVGGDGADGIDFHLPGESPYAPPFKVHDWSTFDQRGDGARDVLLAVDDRLLVAHSLRTDELVGWLLNLPAPTGPNIPSGASSADFDGDGWADVAAIRKTDMVVFRGVPDTLGFEAGVHVQGFADAVGFGRKCVAGDFNGDGVADLAFTTRTTEGPDANLRLLPNVAAVGSGVLFSPGTTGPPVLSGAGRMVAGDWDGDGDLDLAAAAGDRVRLAINLGRSQGGVEGEFDGVELAIGSFDIADIGVADVDGDGDLDFVLLASYEEGEEYPTWRTSTLLSGGGPAVEAGDFNFARGALAPGEPSAPPKALQIGDWDGDGDVDLIHVAGSRLNLSYNQGIAQGGTLGQFELFRQSFHMAGPFAAIGDGNGDGAPDALVPKTTEILRNSTPQVASGHASGTRSVDLRFTERMGPSALDASHYVLSGAGAGTLAASPDRVEHLHGGVYRLWWDAGEFADAEQAAVEVGFGAKDLDGNRVGFNRGAQLGRSAAGFHGLVAK